MSETASETLAEDPMKHIGLALIVDGLCSIGMKQGEERKKIKEELFRELLLANAGGKSDT